MEEMKKFERSVLIGGDRPTYIYQKGDQKILVNESCVKLDGIVVSNPDELQHLASVISSSYLDHQKLARGERKLAPKRKMDDEHRAVPLSLVKAAESRQEEQSAPEAQEPSDAPSAPQET